MEMIIHWCYIANAAFSKYIHTVCDKYSFRNISWRYSTFFFVALSFILERKCLKALNLEPDDVLLYLQSKTFLNKKMTTLIF